MFDFRMIDDCIFKWEDLSGLTGTIVVSEDDDTKIVSFSCEDGRIFIISCETN